MTDWTNLQESRNIDEKNFIPTEFNNWIEILKLEHIKQMTTTVKINTVYFLFYDWFLTHQFEIQILNDLRGEHSLEGLKVSAWVLMH